MTGFEQAIHAAPPGAAMIGTPAKSRQTATQRRPERQMRQARALRFQQNCKDIVATVPHGRRPLPLFVDLPVYAPASGGEVMLMPAQRGCDAISVIHARG